MYAGDVVVGRADELEKALYRVLSQYSGPCKAPKTEHNLAEMVTVFAFICTTARMNRNMPYSWLVVDSVTDDRVVKALSTS